MVKRRLTREVEERSLSWHQLPVSWFKSVVKKALVLDCHYPEDEVREDEEAQDISCQGS